MTNKTRNGHRVLFNEPQASVTLPVPQLEQLRECWQQFHPYTSDDWYEDILAALDHAIESGTNISAYGERPEEEYENE
jgi:cytosine/adenosine deaminase-related metal-dependent hydrolase